MTAPARRGGARVRVADVTRGFGEAAPVLCRLDLEVAPGEIVAIGGPSGSGKTTLLQLVGGLDRPDAGDVWVDDVHVSAERHPVRLRREVVGFVFQLHHLLPTLSVVANVELPLVAAGVRRRERRARAMEALGRVGLADRAGGRPEQLSGGERQRVALARAIVHRPRLLLADEPTGALDQRSAERVLGVLAGLREDDGTTIVAVSHDPALTARADRVLTLDGGVLTGVAAAAEVARP